MMDNMVWLWVDIGVDVMCSPCFKQHIGYVHE